MVNLDLGVYFELTEGSNFDHQTEKVGKTIDLGRLLVDCGHDEITELWLLGLVVENVLQRTSTKSMILVVLK